MVPGLPMYLGVHRRLGLTCAWNESMNTSYHFFSHSAGMVGELRLGWAVKLTTSACEVRRRWCLFIVLNLHAWANLTWSKPLVSACVNTGGRGYIPARLFLLRQEAGQMPRVLPMWLGPYSCCLGLADSRDFERACGLRLWGDCQGLYYHCLVCSAMPVSTK